MQKMQNKYINENRQVWLKEVESPFNEMGRICVTHILTGRHFPKIIESYSGHPKMRKSIKNWKSKISISILHIY